MADRRARRLVNRSKANKDMQERIYSKLFFTHVLIELVFMKGCPKEEILNRSGSLVKFHSHLSASQGAPE